MRQSYLFLISLVTISLSSCHGDYSPKPKAYPRVVFPERNYEMYDSKDCPFRFEKPVYAQIQHDSSAMGMSHPCWINIAFPDFNGTVNLTYKEINKDMTLERLLEDAHKLSFKHTKKANYIDESLIVNKHGVSGIFYNVGGDAASNVQFFLTDSSRHFIRGSLYFYNEPNSDSMAPVLTFVRQDLDTMLSTFEWK
ncbi:MAG: gliding motility lipoprotein GldD [Bacteroidetes bacterium]|nr:gliding motility lipoprotein GldD [Bacteroidota bacterium]